MAGAAAVVMATAAAVLVEVCRPLFRTSVRRDLKPENVLIDGQASAPERAGWVSGVPVWRGHLMGSAFEVGSNQLATNGVPTPTGNPRAMPSWATLGLPSSWTLAAAHTPSAGHPGELGGLHHPVV